jgi:peptidoglycan/xylan/chitin deacetylase (PgdA/CDA1 family)
VTRRIVAEGHEIGNHTWDHRSLAHMNSRQIRAELTRTADAVQHASGVRPSLIRPPFGATDKLVERTAGGPLILWSVDTRDWRDRNTRIVYQRAVGEVDPGGIILLHDTRPTTVAAVPQIIDTLRQRGYQLVTVSQLLGGRLQPGRQYNERQYAPPTTPPPDRRSRTRRSFPRQRRG